MKYKVGDRVIRLDRYNSPSVPPGTKGKISYIGDNVINIQWLRNQLISYRIELDFEKLFKVIHHDYFVSMNPKNSPGKNYE